MTPDKPFTPKQEKPPIDMAKAEQEVLQKIEQYKKLPIISKAFELIYSLSGNLEYHNKEHTEDVLHESILFAILESQSEEDIKKIAISAAWHDVGFNPKGINKEENSVRLLKENMGNLSDEEIQDIEQMILDTKVIITDNGPEIIMAHQRSRYLHDGDLSNLGRPDFREKLDKVAHESGVNMQEKESKLKFLNFTLKLITNQKWRTEIARDLRQNQKEKNIIELEKEIASLY